MDNGNQPATKQDILDLRRELQEENQALEVRIDNRFHSLEERLEKWVDDMEARIVATVYRLGDSGQKRLTEAEREAAAIKDRMATLEERMTEVERRLDMPPHHQA